MKVELEVIKGPYKGKVFTFTEPDCFIIGRDGEGCHAHFRFEREKDMYVSRNHFLLEVKPPNCYIMDNNSKNGTFVKKSGAFGFERITRAELGDGDLIQVGETIIQVKIQKVIKEQVFYYCIRCGGKIIDDLNTGDLAICDVCKEEEKKKAKKPTLNFLCSICGKDVTSKANEDGKAEEFLDVVTYVCEKCVDKMQEKLRPQTPKKLSNYRILKELGAGGMAVVYKAWDENTFRIVALKKLFPNYLRDENSKKFFQREMSITSSLIHPNIVRYIAGDYSETESYFVMEYIKDGCAFDLLEYQYEHGIPYQVACDIICQALDGLEYAHTHPKRFIHRDIKPQNILIKKDNNKFVAKISDFGIAKSADEAGGTILVGSKFIGTILFMSPQQIINYKSPEPHFDTYSMGMSFYLLLTNRFPFESVYMSPLSIIRGIIEGKEIRMGPIDTVLNEHPIPILRIKPDIPEKLAKVVDKSIKKKPEERFLSAKEFKEAIIEAIRR